MTVDAPPTTPRDDDDLEAALRAMLARRAGDVTPRLGGEPTAAPPLAVMPAGHCARRRRPPHRTLFTALAAAAAAAIVVGAVTLLPGGGGGADVATEAPAVIWPLGDGGEGDVAAMSDDGPAGVAADYLTDVLGSPLPEQAEPHPSLDGDDRAEVSFDLNGLATTVDVRRIDGAWRVTGAASAAVDITTIAPSRDGVAITVALRDPDAIAGGHLDLIGATGDTVATAFLVRNLTPDGSTYQLPCTCVLRAPAGTTPVAARLVAYGQPADRPGALGSGVPMAVASAPVPGAAAAAASPAGAAASAVNGTPLPDGVDALTAAAVLYTSEIYRGDPTWSDWRAAVEAWLKVDADPARWTGPPVITLTGISEDGLQIRGRYAAPDGGTGSFRLARLARDAPWFLLYLQDDTLRVTAVERVAGALNVTVESGEGGSVERAPYDQAGVARLWYVNNGPDGRLVRLVRAWLPDDDEPDGPRRPPAATPG
jgi:hypothetical protein